MFAAEFLILKYNVPFYFGGTSLLIIVVVTMDFMAQVQNYMMSQQQYESLLKKANFKTTPKVQMQGETPAWLWWMAHSCGFAKEATVFRCPDPSRAHGFRAH